MVQNLIEQNRCVGEYREISGMFGSNGPKLDQSLTGAHRRSKAECRGFPFGATTFDSRVKKLDLQQTSNSDGLCAWRQLRTLNEDRRSVNRLLVRDQVLG